MMTKLEWFAGCAAAALISAALPATGPAHAAGQDPEGSREVSTSALALTAQDEDEDDCDLEDDEDCDPEEAVVEEIEDWDEFLDGKEVLAGFFTFYRDEETGELFMEVAEDQLGEEFIYFSYTADGSRRDGMRMAGLLQDNAILSLRRRYRHVDVIMSNTAYTQDEDSALSRSEGVNVPNPILASLEVASENPDNGRIVVKADDLFMTKGLVRIGHASPLGRLLGETPGTLNNRKTNLREVRSYEDNTEVVAEYVFDWADAETPYASSDTTTVQHTFLRMPEDGFTPRRADPRVGYFAEQRTNLSVIDGSPVDDLIQRWRLTKTDPGAEISGVEEPITFWIDNATPEEFRDVVAEAVLSWNPVFEQAGFRDAIDVRVQPDDADWDAGDSRYNVIRWMSSPSPVFAGYGPRYTNPRTGEILGADIVIEHSTIQRWIRTDRMFPGAEGGLSSSELDHVSPEGGSSESVDFAEHLPRPEHMCEAGAHMAAGRAFAQLAAAAAGTGVGDAAAERIIREGVAYVVAHEVGHTLGLTHNLIGSHYAPLDELNGDDAEQRQLLTTSIMEYPGVNVAPDRETQKDYFPAAPGPYDAWAIGFGYDEEMDADGRRREHLALSTLREHRFANDADVMRSPGLGMDPRVTMYSLSSEPIAFAERQIELIRDAMDTLVETTSQEDASWNETRQSFELLMNIWMQSSAVMSRYVGGVYSDQSFVGQDGAAEAPLIPVSAAEQRAAIQAMGAQLFSDDAFDFPPELVARLQPERRGFSAFGRTTEPTVQYWVHIVQSQAIAHMVHPRVLNRLTDTMAYGGDYTTHEMLSDLTDEIFGGGEPGVYRRNLQIDFVGRLLTVKDASALRSTPAVAVEDALRRIQSKNEGWDFWMSAEQRAHRRHIRRTIEDAME